MCPASVGTSRASRALETGQAKLWVLLVGVNQYQDDRFPSLSYSALDCQGLGEAIAAATGTFPQKTVFVHHDFAELQDPAALAWQTRSSQAALPHQVALTGRLRLKTTAKLRNLAVRSPKLAHLRASLQQILFDAQPQDTVLFYFSGHGVLDPTTQQVVLCLGDTDRDNLLSTGFNVQELLTLLAKCAAHQQIVWLDACHSGGMSFRFGLEAPSAPPLPNPTPQLVNLLQQQAARSKGFYALLSCDQNQQSWEFPELGHGVFTYYLMRGLLGEAADAQGMIEADALYKYVYYQTLRYIDKTNQQLRLINQQKRGRGDTQLQPEYPLQTPKRIVEGIGELIIGIKPERMAPHYPRQALVIDGLGSHSATLLLSKVLRNEGCFQLTYLPQAGKEWAFARNAIQQCLQSETDEIGSKASAHQVANETTALLYLRGHTVQTSAGETHLVLKDGVTISRSWLRRELGRSPVLRQIVILDCPKSEDLTDWIEELQIASGQGQCLIAAASPAQDIDWFAHVLQETLSATDRKAGLSIAGWIAQIQAYCTEAHCTPHVWLSGTQGVIEVIPSQAGNPDREASTAFDVGVCPYLGLRAFSEEDTDFFFGRDNLTRQLVNALSQRSFLAVVGASGSGKSSVVQAGLLSQLRSGKVLPYSQQWWMRVMRPGATPVESLIQQMVEGLPIPIPKPQLAIEGMLHLGVEGFVHWLRSRPEPMVVLVVDQFEELFTLASELDRRRFLELVFGAIEHAGDRFKLVITLRTDFIAPCLEYPLLAQSLQDSSVLVPPVLNEADYRRVIVQPAEKVGLTVEPELVEVLLQELSHMAGDLPLLEFVLEQLWEQRQPGKLTLQVYQQQIGGLKGALERKAQAVFESLDAEAQACARWIFLSLTQLGEGTEDTRRRIHKSDLIVKKYPEALVDRTLHALTTAKLLVVSTEQSREEQSSKGAEVGPQALDFNSSLSAIASPDVLPVTVEVAHEILIRHWSTLRWWLTENRAHLHILRQVEQSALQWKQSGEQPDFLLRGVPLEAAEELYVKYTDELSADIQRFIEAGLEANAQEQRQAKRRLRRAQLAATVIGVLGLAAVGFGGFAYLQRQQALLNQIAALNALSESQLRSHRQLEALITAVQSEEQRQQISGFGINTQQIVNIRTQTIATLQQALSLTDEQNRLSGHTQSISSVSVSPNGEWIASGSDDATVRLWQPDGAFVTAISLPDRVTAVAFSLDSQRLGIASADGTVMLWDLRNRTVQDSFNAGDWVTSLAFSPNRSWMAIGSRDQSVQLWDLTNLQPLYRFVGHSGWVNQVVFSPDGQTIASASEDNTIKLWNLEQGILIRTLSDHTARVIDLEFSPNGQRLISASGDQTIRAWDLQTGAFQVFSLQEEGGNSHGDRLTSLSIRSDGRLIASASADQTMRFWTLDGTLLKTMPLPEFSISSVQFSPDGQRLISGGTDALVRIWQVATPEQSEKTADAVSVSPEGKTFASAGVDGSIQFWQQRQDATMVELSSIAAHPAPIAALAYSPNGQQLASGSDDQTIKLWQPQTRQLLYTLTGHQARVTTIAFSADGNLLASGSDDRTVQLWNPIHGRRLATLTGHQDGVTTVAFSPNQDLLASGSYDDTIRLWHSNGRLLRTLTGHGLAIAALAFSPDGSLLASASWDNSIKLWRISDGSLVSTLTGHQDGVTNLTFSPDGKTLVSGSADRTLKFWNPNQGTLLKTLYGQNTPIASLSFSPDGSRLLTGGDASVQLWNLDADELLNQGCERLQNYLESHRTSATEKLCAQ
ncbi:MAG: caspase family protein [Elainellaceae cyanobacterium]